MDEDSIKQAQIDATDIHAERAGLETGRIERFHAGGDVRRTEEAERKKGEGWRSFLSLLDRLMENPVYKAAVERAKYLLTEIQDKMDAAVLRNAESIQRLQNLRDDLLERAFKLPDGRAVFRVADGSLILADGSLLNEASDLASPHIPEGQYPSYEQYAGVRDALYSARERRNRLTDIVARLDGARSKLRDPDNPPPDVEAVEEIIEDVQKAGADIDEIVGSGINRNFAEATSSVSSDPNQPELEALAIPDLTAQTSIT